MPLPQAVLEQDRIADELIAADQAARKAATEADVEAPVVAPVVPPVTEPAPVAASDPAPAPEVEATWERKYHTLNGKYLAEVPRLHAKVKELEAAVKKLTDNPPKPPESLLTPEEVEKYGPEFMDMVKRAAEEQAGAHIRALEARLDQFEGSRQRDQEDAATQAKATFFTDLNTAHADWESIDQDPKWISWLKEYDPVGRAVRQALLDDAITSCDSAYVIKLLDVWKASNKARPSPPAVSPEPSTSKADAPGEPPKKIWTNAEITAFYKKQSQKGYSEEEGDKIEQEIQLAIAEKRVRN